MKFWGAEVKVGESVKVDPQQIEACIHLSQAALGETKKDKANEHVVLYLKVGDQKLVLGTLNREKIPQTTLVLVLDKVFELSHSSKTSSVHFCGYKAYYPDDGSEEDDFSDSDDEEIPLAQPIENGKPEPKAADQKVSDAKATAKSGTPAEADAPKQVKVVDPKEEKDDDSDDDSDEMDEFGSEDGETPVKKMDEFGSEDGETPVKKMDEFGSEYGETPVKKMDEFGSEDGETPVKKMDEFDSEDGETPVKKMDEFDSEDGETPVKKVDQGKKRANKSASKTPVPSKKSKNATPEKTDNKKVVHTATPHPKKAGKTPNSEAKSPKSGGHLFCSNCIKTFDSETGLSQHSHGAQ